MKIPILVIGYPKNKKISFTGFSLLEIIIVISLISILSLFIGLSSNFIALSKNNIPIYKKLNLIEEEIRFLKKLSLSENSEIELSILKSDTNSKIFLRKTSFKNCELQDSNSKKIYIYPSGELTSFKLECLINNNLFTINVDTLGKTSLDEK